MSSPPAPLIRRGDEGSHVLDLQRRLRDAGHTVEGDPSGAFGPGTEAAVQAFQHSRSVRADGIVGHDTWSALLEAGWRLGDRVLYERRPWLRGDDVAELQERLAGLGFDVGKVDGIFGPLARNSVTEFQRNCGLVADGVVGVDTVRTLLSVGKAPAGRPNPAVRERLLHRSRGKGVVARRIFVDARTEGVAGDGGDPDLAYLLVATVAGDLRRRGALTMLSRSADEDPDESERAMLANWFGSELVLSIGVAGDADAPSEAMFTSYYGSPRYLSSEGRIVSRLIGDELASQLLLKGTPPQASAAVILRETRAVAVIVEVSAETATATADIFGRAVGTALATYFSMPEESEDTAG